MDNILRPGSHNSALEEELEALPELVCLALENWRISTLNRERRVALLSAKLRGQNPSFNSTQIKELVQASDEYYDAHLDEIKNEAKYTKIYETLLCKKREASLRIAF